MKKEFLLLSVLISSAIFVFLIYPISNLIQLDEKNITKLDKFKKAVDDSNSLYETMLDKTTESLEKILSNTESISKIQ